MGQENASVNEEALWNALPAQLLHEVQLWIIEAMLWIERPVSPVEVTGVLDGEQLARSGKQLTLTGVAYHFNRLSNLEVVTCVASTQVRGAEKKTYRLRVPARVG